MYLRKHEVEIYFDLDFTEFYIVMVDKNLFRWFLAMLTISYKG